MIEPTQQHFVVLGGGLAGLVAARELLRKGCRVTLIEKNAEVGGLARTFEQDGFRFDIGGHRFHSNNPSVVQWLKDLLKTDLLVVPRISHIYLNKKFVDYPIQFPDALSVFSPFKAMQMVVSYLSAKVTERGRQDISFEDWVVKRYGKALYRTFFQPYTEKVWGIACDQLAASWASQRIGIPSLLRVIKQAVQPTKDTPATAISQFYYPRAGFGMIPQALEKEILQTGGILHTSTTLLECVPLSSGFRITAQHEDGTCQTIQADQVISTIPVNYLLQSIPAELGSQEILRNYTLEYRDIVCLFVALNRKQVSTDSWTYFPLRNLIFGRTHEPKNWSAEMVPSDDYTSLAIEIFSSRNEPIWNMTDDEILAKVVEQMDEIGWIQKSDVHKSWVLRVPYAYPVYHIGYQEKLRAVKNYLGQWENLHLAGRTGSFHYMNSDGVIEDIFQLMETLFPEKNIEVKSLASVTGRWM
ncbi:MAG: FAD-dependent oxidoreductase [Scytolyngbya sp. HA4215-MV1]|nr:FAD-dependent oxidoreductase [Scytolyngbya sp. HA4215-MV1]